GPGNTAVIAKRSRAGEAQVEQTIYEEILPDLPISSLTFYGVVDEPGTDYRWLFLEDAENADFTRLSDEHRKLAARWLGLMHVSAERVFAVSRLPNRGPQHYLDHLYSSRRVMQDNIGDPSLSYQDIRLFPYPAKAGCPTVAGRRRTRAAPAGIAPALSWSKVMVAHWTARLIK